MMLDDYNMLLANKSQPVRVLDKISPYEGVALEIDKDGALLVRVQSGEIRKVCSGVCKRIVQLYLSCCGQEHI